MATDDFDYDNHVEWQGISKTFLENIGLKKDRGKNKSWFKNLSS